MSKEIIVYTGIGSGEEGKGNSVEFAVRETHAHTVIRTGGFQGAHNITLENGEEHMFRHFGAGTFEGANTHLQHMVINPVELFQESEDLADMGIVDPLIRITVDEECLTATKLHASMSRFREIMRGKNKKGTIGKGVGEAVRDAKTQGSALSIRAKEFGGQREVLQQKVRAIQQYKLQQANELIERMGLDELPDDALAELRDLRNPELVDEIVESMISMNELVQIVGRSFLDLLLERNGVMVTETSHGALLDPRYGFAPHTTQIDPTSQDILSTLKERNYSGKIVRLGVSRAISNRHGAGPIVTHDPTMSSSIIETHNNADLDWLGEFRMGPYDAVAYQYGIEISGGKDSFDGLAINFMDTLDGKKEWPVCEAYSFESELPVDINEFFVQINGLITAIKVHPDAGDDEHYQHQLRLTELLNSCRPVITLLTPTADKTLEQVFREYIEKKLGVPVVATGRGPKASDRAIIPGYENLFVKNSTMVELPEFQKIGSTGVNQTQQNFEKIESFRVGYEGPIHHVSVSLERHGKVRAAGDMYIKAILNPDAAQQKDSFSIYKKWLWLRQHQIPVVSTLRSNEEGDALLMSDVTENGKYRIIDKHHQIENPELEIKNLAQLKAQLLDIAEKAFDQGNGVFLGWEAYAILLDKNGMGKLVVLDIGAQTLLLENGRANGELYSDAEAMQKAQKFIDNCLTESTLSRASESPSFQNIFLPASVDLFFLENGRPTNLPEHLAKNPELLRQAAERRKIAQIFKQVTDKIPDPRMTWTTAVRQNLISVAEMTHLFQELAEFIKKNPLNGKILLYLPAQLLPALSSEFDVDAALNNAQRVFAKVYKKAWYELLEISTPRANWTNGDIGERGMSAPERVRKAAHLIPEMLDHGLIEVTELTELIRTTEDDELVHSLEEGLLAARGKANQTDSLDTSLTAVEKIDRENSPYVESISHKRTVWENGMARAAVITQAAVVLAEKLCRGEVGIHELEQFFQKESEDENYLLSGIQAVFMAGELFAKTDSAVAASFVEKYLPLMQDLWQNDHSATQDAISTGLNHWFRLELVTSELVVALGIQLPDLAAPFPVNVDQILAHEGKFLVEITQKIKAHPVLSHYLMPTLLAFGSRFKGYGTSEADFDAAIFFKPEAPWEKRSEVLKLLHQDIPEMQEIDAVLEYWLDETDGVYGLRQVEDEPASMVGPQEIHFLFGGVWINQDREAKKVYGDLVGKYVDLTRFGEDKGAISQELTGQLELDLLQYRLLHKGYYRHYPDLKEPGTAHQLAIDGDSAFWDPGYRRVATQLFLSRVYLPDLAEF